MIYFIQCQKTGYVKVGYSKRPEKRLKTFQTGYPFDLKLAAIIEGNRQAEHLVHTLLKADHVRGEWFMPSHEMIDHITRNKTVQTFIKRDKLTNLIRDLRRIRSRYVLNDRIKEKILDVEREVKLQTQS